MLFPDIHRFFNNNNNNDNNNNNNDNKPHLYGALLSSLKEKN